MEKTNLVIIGSGPAAYTAAIYVARSGLKPILFQGFKSGIVGGQLMTTTKVENFPGFPEGILGPNLMENMEKQALFFNTKIIKEDVLSVDLSKTPFLVNGSKTKFETDSIIIATGAEAKRLDIPGAGDNEFWQKGVSACAICDGAIPIFRQKELFVVGGGDSALEEALYLTKFAKKVYIVHRRDSFRASNIMSKRAMDNEKIDVLWNMEMIEILGDSVVSEVILKNNKTGERKKMKAAGVFFAIGRKPNSEFLNNQLPLDKFGHIIVEKGSSKTKVEGIFAAGDVQDPSYRQAIVAAGSGCMAALDTERWLMEKGFLD